MPIPGLNTPLALLPLRRFQDKDVPYAPSYDKPIEESCKFVIFGTVRSKARVV